MAAAAKNLPAGLALDQRELLDFILDRLRGYYADKGVPGSHFTAVAELKPKSLYDFDRRIDAIGTFAQLPEAAALAAVRRTEANTASLSQGASVRRSRMSALTPAFSAAASQRSTIAPHATTVMSLPSRTRFATPNGNAKSSPG